MPRTSNRPLVTGALSSRQVLIGATVALVAGLALVFAAGGWFPVGLHAAAAIVYLGIYTPLKRRTSTNTWIGAIPGALPVLAGAAAAHGTLPLLPLIVFLLILLWQLPHFFAIASMYREDYQRGGMRMLSGEDPDDSLLRWQMPLMVMSVVLVSVLPLATGSARAVYGLAALVLGAMFLRSAFRFRSSPEPARARGVVVASVTYLPLLLVALVVDTSLADRPSVSRNVDAAVLPVLAEVPDFELTDQDGRAFTAADMAGDVWIVDFFFTGCAGICVPMSQALVDFQTEGLPARCLSISIDPGRDEPAVLSRYREKWKGDPERWTLLTGDFEAIEALAGQGFRLGVQTRGGAAQVAAPVEGMPDMFHSGKFALVDADGGVRGYYDHDDSLDLDRLRADVRRLAP
jgi:protoheme IX farnesyltransferase